MYIWCWNVEQTRNCEEREREYNIRKCIFEIVKLLFVILIGLGILYKKKKVEKKVNSFMTIYGGVI